MNRDTTFTMRVSPTERELIAAIAARLERNESDTLRLLLREKARELGLQLLPMNQAQIAQTGR